MKNLKQYIQDPYNSLINYQIGEEYYEIGQTAAALSFFLRAAEYSNNKGMQYDALIMVGQCLTKQNRRYNSEMGVYLQAINVDHERPEAYYCLSLLYERKKEWLECYTNAKLSFKYAYNNKLNNVYPRDYGSLFQMGISAWWIGQIDLSKSLFESLLNKDIPENYRECVNNNLNYINNIK